MEGFNVNEAIGRAENNMTGYVSVAITCGKGNYSRKGHVKQCFPYNTKQHIP
jgi:hypothetical protein